MAELSPGTAASRPSALMRSVRDVAVTGGVGVGGLHLVSFCK